MLHSATCCIALHVACPCRALLASLTAAFKGVLLYLRDGPIIHRKLGYNLVTDPSYAESECCGRWRRHRAGGSYEAGLQWTDQSDAGSAGIFSQ
eukprot:8010128-Pyramimonas_sp.AAC.1